MKLGVRKKLIIPIGIYDIKKFLFPYLFISSLLYFPYNNYNKANHNFF